MKGVNETSTKGRRSGPSPLLRRAILTFVSPAQLMQELRHYPRAVGALLLGALLAGLANAAIPAEIWELVIRNQLLAAGQDLPEDLAATAALTRWAGSAATVVFWPLFGVLVSAIYSLVFLAGLGYNGRFQQYLSVTAHALLIGAVGLVLVLPLRILAQDVRLTLTVGAFAPGLDGGLIARFLGYLDLFNLWAAGLVGLGASIVDGKHRTLTSIVAALGTSVLIALLLATTIA